MRACVAVVGTCLGAAYIAKSVQLGESWEGAAFAIVGALFFVVAESIRGER